MKRRCAVAALATVISAFGPETASAGPPTTPALSRSAATPAAAQSSGDPVSAGKAAFERVCQACHGPEARGDAGPRLVPFSREFDEVLGIVREGAGQMPPTSSRQLSDEGVAQIVAYLKSLTP